MSDDNPECNKVNERCPNTLVEYRLSEVEREVREALPSIRNDLHAISKQLAEMTQYYRHQASLREEINQCKTQHAEGDSKLWQSLNEERTKRETLGNELITERGRIDAVHRPLWLLFGAVLIQSLIVIYTATQN